MEQKKQNLANGETEKPLAAPRFDKDAIHHARPAVPLDEPQGHVKAHLRQATNELTSSRLALALVIISMLASGVIGALATVLYQRHAEAVPPVSIESSSGDDSYSETASEPENSAPGISDEAARDGSKEMARGQTLPVNEANDTAPVKGAGEREELLPVAQDDEGQRSSLRTALDQWVATTNARDLQRQKEFYMPQVNAFYRARNVSREAVLADKGRAFETADLIDVRAARPEIKLHPDGHTATMRFRKQYAIKNGQQDRRGEVLSELQWRRTDGGWKIISERDVRVIQ